ncbi:hypothetical protein NKG94_21225 [Micromonospora sp. M12]
MAVVYGCLAGLGTATTTIGLLEQFPGDVIERNIGLPAAAITFAIVSASWVIAAIILGLVIGGIFAYRTEPYRRHIGVLWDLGTFWPRPPTRSRRPATPSGPCPSWPAASRTSSSAATRCCSPGTATARSCSPPRCSSCLHGSAAGSLC